jgi:hypothetical protein
VLVFLLLLPLPCESFWRRDSGGAPGVSRAAAAVVGLLHGGDGADAGEGEVMSLWQPGARNGGVGIGAHAAPFDGDVEDVGTEHSVLVQGVPVQGSVGGAVPGLIFQ